MRDLDLEILELQGARWVPIQPGTKRPQGRDWQHHPRRLTEIGTPAVGMLLGAPSAGIMAVDFDGESALEYWHTHILEDLPDSVMWTSGRPGRCQMALRVPAELAALVPTKFAVSTAPGEQLEWRYGRDRRGFQSVMPPSPHPDTQGYAWVSGHSPQHREIAEAPWQLLEWALQHHQREQQRHQVLESDTLAGPLGAASIPESQALRRIGEIIAGMRPGDRSHRACQVGALLRSVRGELHARVFDQLRAQGCDRAALASARRYSRG